MTREEINRLTDWVGIPLTLLLFLLLILIDLRSVGSRRQKFGLIFLTVLVGAGAIAMNLYRFSQLA